VHRMSRARRPGSPWRASAAAACVVLAAVALVVAPAHVAADVTPGTGNGNSSHPEAPHPHLQLSQFQGLSDGQTIVVRGTGFCPYPGTSASCQGVFGVEECRAPVNGSSDCDQTTLPSPQKNPGRDDASGTFELQVQVRATITLPSGQKLACNATGSCAVGASNFLNAPDFSPAAYEAIGFGSSAASAAAAGSTSAAASAGATSTATAAATPTSTPRPVTPLSVTTGWPAGTQLSVGLAGLGIVVLGGVAGYFLTGRFRRRPPTRPPGL